MVTLDEIQRFKRITAYLDEKYSIGLIDTVQVGPIRAHSYYPDGRGISNNSYVCTYGYHRIEGVPPKYLPELVKELAYLHYRTRLTPMNTFVGVYIYSFGSLIEPSSITVEDVESMAVFLSKTQKGVWKR